MQSLHPDSEEALSAIAAQARPGTKIVFVSGNFNIVHPGHLRLLRFARECGDFLVVGVFDDGIGTAILPEDLRLEGIKSTSWVDFAFLLRDPPEVFLDRLRPGVVVKGKEHENLLNAEQPILDAYGGRLMFSSGDVTFSSIDLLRAEFDRVNACTLIRPQDFFRRHGLTAEGLKRTLERVCRLKVVVIGDLIVDEYITCDPLGMSQEDPTLVVTPLFRERFVGGAGIVAAHVRGLGAQVDFFSVVGRDAIAEFAGKQLADYRVNARLYEDPSRPTTHKQRYRAMGKTLLRVNQLRQHVLARELQERIIQDLTLTLADAHLLIFSDFNYGCLPQPLVEQITNLCALRGIMMVADSQSSSQIGDVSRFRGTNLLTPTEREARLALHDTHSGLVVLADALQKKAAAKNIIITLGEEGLLIHTGVFEQGQWLNDRLPALNTTPKDPSGAGDSFLACGSVALAAGSDIWHCAYLGSLAAACQVARIGNVPVNVQNLLEQLDDRRSRNA
jgi:rfaE bifunctional protein kinase chain/domain